jgi:hypothetical protein
LILTASIGEKTYQLLLFPIATGPGSKRRVVIGAGNALCQCPLDLIEDITFIQTTRETLPRLTHFAWALDQVSNVEVEFVSDNRHLFRLNMLSHDFFVL